MRVLEIKNLVIRRMDSLPDIDVDFEGIRRNDVKRYIEEKYTADSVCSVGTYGKMKVKSAIKDFSRIAGVTFLDANLATKAIPDSIGKSYWSDIFENALKKPMLKKFVQNNVEVCNQVRISLNQPKSSSVHASAVIIAPKEDKHGNKMTIFDWMPVKKIDGQLISEWEGKFIDIAGFLKADILGIAQLDKFQNIITLIKKNRGKKVNLNKIKIDIPEVMEYFQKGWNEDVFQFGTSGLKNYSKLAKPDSLEELIAMNALFRPGPMDSNAHGDFADIKHGRKTPKFDKGMEEITKNTFGLYVYQETIMQAMVVGGMSLVESDQVRTYMKKFDKENLGKMKDKFVTGYSRIVEKKQAEKVWDKLMAFSSYGFNKSHAAAYSLMGYWCQYLKLKYPLEFWTASLNFADYEEQIPNRISEMKKIGIDISIKPPCVNISDLEFVGSTEHKSIYWSLKKIKNVGEVATNVILQERATNGMFFDFEDFLGRVPKNKVNKRVVKNLIISGAFDNIGGVNGMPLSDARERLDLLKKHCILTKSPDYEEMSNVNAKTNWYWILEQKALTGFGEIDFKQLLRKTCKKLGIKNMYENYMPSDEYDKKNFTDLKSAKPVTVVGKILFIKEKIYRTSKLPYLLVTIESNNVLMFFYAWNDSMKDLKEKIENCYKAGSLIALNLQLTYDDKYGKSLSTISERGSRKNLSKLVELN